MILKLFTSAGIIIFNYMQRYLLINTCKSYLLYCFDCIVFLRLVSVFSHFRIWILNLYHYFKILKDYISISELYLIMDRLQKFKELKMRNNEARKLNHREVVEEDRRNKLPANYEAKRKRAEWEISEFEKRKEAEERGEDYDRLKLLQMPADIAWKLQQNPKALKKQRNKEFKRVDFCTAAIRNYERLSEQIKPDFQEYNGMKELLAEDFYPDSNTLIQNAHYPSDSKIDRLIEDLNMQKARREKARRRKEFDPDAPIDYINERNKQYNMKLDRYYDHSYVKMARAAVSPYIRRNSRLRPLTSCIQRRNHKGGNLSMEGFEEEVLQLKKKIQYLNEDNMLLKIKLNKYDVELKKKVLIKSRAVRLFSDDIDKIFIAFHDNIMEKEIKDLLSSQKHSFMSIAQGERGILLNSLKQRVIRLEHLLREKDELIRKLKCDIRSTRLNEAAIEIDTLYGEINRLKAMCGLKSKSVYSTGECSSYDTLSNVASWTSEISGSRHEQREKYHGEKKRTAQASMSEEENNTDGNFQKESSSSSVDNDDVEAEKVDCSDDCTRNKLEKATSFNADVSELENLKERMKHLEDSLADRETRLVEITNMLTDCQEQLTIQQKFASNKVDKCSSEQSITEGENRFLKTEKSEGPENDSITSQAVEVAECENSSSEFNNGKSDRELKMASRLIVNVVKAHLFRLKQIEALKSSNFELSKQFQSGSVDQNFNENGEAERKQAVGPSIINTNQQAEDESESGDDDDDHIVVVESEKSNELYNFDIDSDADIIMVPDSPEKSWRSEATPTGELGGQEKPDWLGGQQPDERGSDEEVQSRKSLSRVCVCSVLSIEVKNNNLLSKKAFWTKYSDNFKQEKLKNILNKQLEDVKQNLLLKRLPDAIIIGVKKAGTRATLEYLRLHDQIKAPGPEIHFFDRNYKYGLDWYREQMPPAAPEDVIIEKTPRYFISPEAPTKIRSMNQKMKLIVVFRDPVTRLLSEYAQIASKRPGLPSFEQMAFLDANRTRVNRSWGAVHTGLYEKHLRHWLKLFPKSQILFISGEQLITNPVNVTANMEQFLNLPKKITDQHFAFGGKFPCLKKLPLSEPHCLGKTKGRLHPVVSEKDLQTLRRFYKPYNDVLYKLIGQSFDW
ncbi:Heparan sulfate glucosamine 3-O-sulfotransferase 3B1 [Trichinella murrelli]|uniref:Heparan sulfate glucosamine 3-O-sulfotransferase 3B1 n=2 Tax=Trichinella TaxID=6333 RepID=A0A0V0TA96_9BILA|nr:Heparan sulfate glucosamine 3-O-sulfotransferase 3B1 [Trichinella murrelli]